MGEKGKNILKIKLLKIWEILNHRSEENAPISTVELIAALNDMGITCDRRTIYADIDCMQAFGYPIHNRRKGHDMLYWVDDRQLNMSEIKDYLEKKHLTYVIPNRLFEKTKVIFSVNEFKHPYKGYMQRILLELGYEKSTKVVRCPTSHPEWSGVSDRWWIKKE